MVYGSPFGKKEKKKKEKIWGKKKKMMRAEDTEREPKELSDRWSLNDHAKP